MKNLLVVLIFSLMSSVAFAETINNPEKSVNVNSVNVNSEQEAPVASTPDFSVESSDELVADNTGEEQKSCTVRGKMTVTTSSGKITTYEGEFTIVGLTCVELLKQVLAQ